MSNHVEYKPLVVVVPGDFGPPIYYSPPEDIALLFSQTLSAILLGVRELDEEQIGVGLESLRLFFNEYGDRKKLYSGGGAILILPESYRDKESYLSKIREIFNTMKIPLTIKYWNDFDLNYSISVFAMDLRLRTELGIINFIMNNLDDIKKWEFKANEYKNTGLIFLGSESILNKEKEEEKDK